MEQKCANRATQIALIASGQRWLMRHWWAVTRRRSAGSHAPLDKQVSTPAAVARPALRRPLPPPLLSRRGPEQSVDDRQRVVGGTDLQADPSIVDRQREGQEPAAVLLGDRQAGDLADVG